MSRPFRLPLHVEEHGSRGRPLLLIHGFGGNGYTWRHWVPKLAERFRVLVVDLKGHGSAPKPEDEAYGPQDHAELIVRTIRGRDLEGVTLIGNSLGGGIALLVALRLLDTEPHRLHSLVLVAGAAFPQNVPPFIGWARRRILGRALLALVSPRRLIRWALRSIVYDPESVTVGQVEAYAEPLTSREGREALLAGAAQILPESLDEIVERYPEIDVPVLLLWGEGDGVVPRWVGERLEEILPDAELVVLDRCGHLPQEERPRASFDVVAAFLEEHGDRGP